MMLETLREVEPRIAAGVLAETALHLEGGARPASRPLVENQGELEQAILRELRAFLNLAPSDTSDRAITLLADALDQQADALTATQDAHLGNERLSAEGLLPSDVYRIEFDIHLPSNFGWRWQIESAFAEETVHRPHREQSLGQLEHNGIDPLITIFARYYQHRFPARSFWMLVIGARRGETFGVSQIWRIYPQDVDLSECATLLDALRAFAQKFGVEINANGQMGKFFLYAPADAIDRAYNKVQVSPKAGETMTFTMFYNSSDGRRYVALVIPVNLTSYFRSVEYWRGWDKDVWRDVHGKSLSLMASAA